MQISIDGTNVVISLFTGELLHFDIMTKKLIKIFKVQYSNLIN